MRGDGLFLVFSLQESDDGRRQRAVVVLRVLRVLNILSILGGYNAIKINLLRPLSSPFTGGKVPVYRRKGPRLQGNRRDILWSPKNLTVSGPCVYGLFLDFLIIGVTAWPTRQKRQGTT